MLNSFLDSWSSLSAEGALCHGGPGRGVWDVAEGLVTTAGGAGG